MRRVISFSLLVCFCLICSSCTKQNVVDPGDSGGFTISGKIENWSLGSDKRAALIYYVTTAETSPDSGTTTLFGVSAIDAQGNFAFTNIPAPPDSLFPVNNGRQYNVGLFSDDSLFFHGYSITTINIINSKQEFVSNLFYSNQQLSVVPYTNTSASVGDYTMMYQYVDRDIIRDSATSGPGIFNLTLYLTYKVTLKKGWNKIFAITTAVSDSSRSALWTTDAPSTAEKWYLSNRYFKMKL